MKYSTRVRQSLVTLIVGVISCGFFIAPVSAQQKAPVLLFFSPSTQTVLEDATFEVSLYLDTNGGSVNTMDITVTFPPDKLTIVKPSGGSSLVQIWIEPPSYSNTDGVAHFVGVIPNGVNTKSGLITTLTFRALAPGEAPITIKAGSRILANDGLGTDVKTQFNRAILTVSPKPPEGVRIFSDTHAFESRWSNNPNAILGWEKSADSSDFSYALDNEPFTVPDNAPETMETTTSFSDLKDGLWYFHIKSRRQEVWGPPTHYLLRIDTTPPAIFTPVVDFLNDPNPFKPSEPKAQISFLTTDAFSGIDHYEVAVSDLAAGESVSPIFVQTESPYQLPLEGTQGVRVVVRAIDTAGNIRDATVIVPIPSSIARLIFDHKLEILLWAMGILLGLILFHYLLGHHILNHVRRIFALLRNEKELEKEEEHVAAELHEESKDESHDQPHSGQ